MANQERNMLAFAVEWLGLALNPSSAMLSTLVLCLAIAGLWPASAQAQTAPVAASNQAKPNVKTSKNEVELQPADPASEAWRTAMLNTRRGKGVCVTATYPGKQWHEVACVTPSAAPIVKPGVRPHIVGGPDPDLTFVTANGYITDGEGSFDKVTGVISEHSNGIPNAFSLQLNTNTFTTPTCSSQPGCRSWVQFVYSSSNHQALIQYWLQNYGDTCPDQWQTDDADGCSRNGNSVSTPSVAIADLRHMKVFGVMGDYLGTPNPDAVAVEIGNTLYESFSNSPIAGAKANWQQMEFNIFGDGGGSRAFFDHPGATIVVRDSMLLGTATSFGCSDFGTSTLESNNLILSNAHPLVAAVGPPSLVFVESNATGTVAGGCNNAVVIQGTDTRDPIKPIVAHKP